MEPKKMIGLLLVAAGILALVYGGFTYTEESHDIELGPLELQVKDKERVNIPVWVGVVAIIAGVGLVAVGRTR